MCTRPTSTVLPALPKTSKTQALRNNTPPGHMLSKEDKVLRGCELPQGNAILLTKPRVPKQVNLHFLSGGNRRGKMKNASRLSVRVHKNKGLSRDLDGHVSLRQISLCSSLSWPKTRREPMHVILFRSL